MILTVFERANLLNILPREGDFRTLRMLRKLRESIALTEAEVERYKPSIAEGRMTWKTHDDAGEPIPQETEVEVGELAVSVIRDRLIELDKTRKLREEHYTLYEKFVGGES